MTVTTTEEPKSGWGSWFKSKYSKVKDKVKKAKNKVKSGLSKAKNAVKKGAKSVGRAIKYSANFTKEGAKKIGRKIKLGFKKFKMKFTRTDNNFNRFADKVNNGIMEKNEKVIEMLTKLGIKVAYGEDGNIITVDKDADTVNNILKNEGMAASPDETSIEVVDFTGVEEYPAGEVTHKLQVLIQLKYQ